MSAYLDNIEQSFSDQLSEFDVKLREQDDNASLLKEIHAAITMLMSQTGDRDTEIREILQKRYNAGQLRLETYQLVRNVLDRVVIESMATMPDAVDEPIADDSYARTTVIDNRPQHDEAPQDQLQVGSVLRDRFLLQERVSGGSMGVVYKALDRRIAEADGVDPWVAVKVLSPKLSKNGHALRALQQEAAKGRCLSHPNIVRFIDLDRDGDMYFIVMEWLEGRSLAAILDEDRNHSLDVSTALDIVRQAGLALDYAHRCGVVHADVKPANIMITPSGQVKLFDFGIARIRQKQHHSRRDFDPGVLGAITPAYSSMQVLTGEDPVPADDVFSLGCLMYRLVAGHRVFGPRNAAEAAEQGMEPQRPQGLTDTQWRALKKTLAYSRVSRFNSPAEFLSAMDAEERRTFTDQPIVVEPKMTSQAPQRRWGFAAITLVVLASVLLLVARPDLIDAVRTGGKALKDRVGSLTTRTTPERPREEQPAAGSVQDEAAEESRENGIAGDPPDSVSEGGPAANTTADGRFTPPGTTADEIEIPSESATNEPTQQSPATGETTQPGESRQGPAQDGRTQTGPFTEGPVQEGPVQNATRQPGTIEDGATPDTGTPMEPGVTDAAMAVVPATVTVPITPAGSMRAEVDLILREDSGAAVVELERETAGPEPLAVVVEEIGFSGNQSPLTTGRYRLSSQAARFDAGQTTARLTISMPSDTVREPDQEATLLLRNAANAASQFAIINLTLEDDDQRSFESGLPQDTVGFAGSQVFVRERDPAVQIDVLRFNPGDTDLEIRYFISGGTATEGDDFFVPGATGLVFAPGQRSARLLIPLVQDATVEDDESFTLELLTDANSSSPDIYREITVIMQDDDSPF